MTGGPSCSSSASGLWSPRPPGQLERLGFERDQFLQHPVVVFLVDSSPTSLASAEKMARVITQSDFRNSTRSRFAPPARPSPKV